MKFFILLIFACILPTSASAGDHGKVGPDKGVIEADEHDGFKLRDGVEARYGVKTQVVGSRPWLWPRSVILYSKGEIQVFRKRDGFWKAVDVSYSRRGQQLAVSSPALKADDAVAIEGAGLLKIIDLSLFNGEEAGHIH